MNKMSVRGEGGKASKVGRLSPIERKKVKLQIPYETSIPSAGSLPRIQSSNFIKKAPIVIEKPKKLNVSPECNYLPNLSSAESELTPLPDHWKDPVARVKRERASLSEVQAEPKKADDDKQRDSIEEETDATLPRTFFPLGVDWDANLESKNYGLDVILKSESSGSSESDEYRNTPLRYYSVNEIFKKHAQQEPHHSQEVDDSSSSEEIIRKRVQMKQEPPSIRFGENWREDGFLQALEAARKRRRKANIEKAKKDRHYSSLNTEVRSEGPMIPRRAWRSDEAQTMKIMRKGTAGRLQSIEDIYWMLNNESAKNTYSYEDYIAELKNVKEELDRSDIVQKVTLTNEFFNEFCYKNEGTHTTDLVLQGKEVYNKIGRRIQDFDLPYIFLFLLSRKDIIYLDFCYNNLTGEGMRLLADYLAWDTQIIGLNLMNNDIEHFESPAIDSLIENTTLKSLRLNGNPIGRKGGEYVAFIIMFKNLEHLDIGQTDQEARSLAWITQALIKNEKLKVLDLSRVLPGLINCGSGSFWMASAIAFSDILREHLKESEALGTARKALTSSTQQLNQSLVELHIQKNEISDFCIEEIMYGLSFNKTIQLLDMSFNRIGDAGATLIADSLQRGAPLRAVLMAGNEIGDDGARALARELPLSQLKMLNLANNKIKDQGIIDIVQCVKKPNPLAALFIFGNPFGSRALEIVNTSINSGALESITLDIDVHYCEGEIGHGCNVNSDRFVLIRKISRVLRLQYRGRVLRLQYRGRRRRYGGRYYQTTGYRYSEAKHRKAQWPCVVGSTVYKYHNVFNPRAPKPFLPPIRKNLTASCCAK